MWRKLIPALLLMLVAIPAAAQTATPTPTPTNTPWATLSAPEYVMTMTVPSADIYQVLSTANANIQQMPASINSTGGVNVDNATQLFGYARWLFSPTAAAELLGQTFAPFAITFFFVLVTTIALATVYFLVWFVILIVRVVLWVVNQILKIVPFW